MHNSGHEPAPPGHWPGEEPVTHYSWRIHHPYGGVDDHVAVEVSPHFGFIRHWRFVLPADYPGLVTWGVGAPGGSKIAEEVRGEVGGGPIQLVNGPEVIWFGSSDRLSSRLSAYLVFHGAPPHYVSFGEAEGPDDPPKMLEGISFGDSHEALDSAHGHSHEQHEHHGRWGER